MNKAAQKVKLAIAESLKAFGKGSLRANATQLFSTLGYTSDKTIELTPNTPENFLHEVDQQKRLRKDKALFSRWKGVDFVFQITGEEIKAGGSSQSSLQFDAHQKIDNRIFESYLFLAIKLRKGHYTRTDLSTITREINKLFPMPVLILFLNGDTLTLSVINRRLHKRDKSKDVLEKVTLIKDIRFANPHRAHIEILFDLSFANLYDRYRFSNFIALHDAWQKTLDSNELNKRFYKELANWYFWAVKEVTFPSQNDIKDKEIRNATNVIRLITRLIFVWFVKEKGLITEDLFNYNKLKDDVLKDLSHEKTTFYKAILQNLFFATLNQEMNTPAQPDNRKFRGKTNAAGGRDQHYMIHNVYRYENYFKNPAQALKLFEGIPFLNGGLFECLDQYKTKPVIRIDGFSEHKNNELKVPNHLFFSEKRKVDLNKDYGTKNKTYKVRGLIDLLQSYKFTITENTPIEEEIALDPELLGKVFENLLASYNPETGTTARKQTGSFYTPREIVNYMVDESLIAYLETKPTSNASSGRSKETRKKTNSINARLRHLFSYSEEPPQFSMGEINALIEAIDTCKILDPACGSGAFPMGILHKLVFMLGKLDPRNEQWKQRQVDKVAKAMKAAEEIDDSAIRKAAVHELEQQIVNIKNAFERNELDYGRKLFLIENCIFGVDIQPIAVQIAKLRFFISLVVDQRIDERRKNRGVLPLPNLETRFVAGNTLLCIEKPEQLLLRNPEIDLKEEELAKTRRKHFTARTTKTKVKYRDLDERLRIEISALLRKDGFPRETTDKLARWDPYNQNASADFFDQEWMFGITEGFDVVIGNPPYVDSEAMVKALPELREYCSKKFHSTKGNWDLYIPFFEVGWNILSKGSSMTYITPNKWLSIGYGKALRTYLRKDFFQLCRCDQIKVFEAGNSPVITFFKKQGNVKKINIHEFDSERDLNFVTESSNKILEFDNWGIFLSDNINLVLKINNQEYSLEKFYEVENPFTTSEAYEIKEILKEKENPNNEDFRFINTGTIDPYITLWGKKKTSYLKLKLSFPVINKKTFLKYSKRRFGQANAKKIIITGMRYFECFLDEHGEYVAGKSTIIIKEKRQDLCLKSLIALLNSQLMTFYINGAYSALGIDGGINISKTLVEALPIPISFDRNQNNLVKTVDKILTIKESNPTAKTTPLEAEIDARVAHLYKLTEEEYSLILSNSKTDDPFRVAALNFYRDIERGVLK